MEKFRGSRVLLFTGSKQALTKGTEMNTENIIRDIRDLIHDVRSYETNASEDRKDAIRVFNRVEEGREYTEHGYETVADGLVDATEALERAKERFGDIEAHLLILIERIEREALSHKIQSR
jgi:hypothetical protein